MHPILGLLMLLVIGAVIAFAFRAGQRVRPDARPDSSFTTASSHWPDHDGGSSHG